VRTILKFTVATQLSVILRIQTKCSDTNSNNPTFQAQNNSKFFLKKKMRHCRSRNRQNCVAANPEIESDDWIGSEKCIAADEEIGSEK
jgi:hypothetical protein